MTGVVPLFSRCVEDMQQLSSACFVNLSTSQRTKTGLNVPLIHADLHISTTFQRITDCSTRMLATTELYLDQRTPDHHLGVCAVAHLLPSNRLG
jgi:hypothetical protein